MIGPWTPVPEKGRTRWHAPAAVALLAVTPACAVRDLPATPDLPATAESFFRAVYGCAPEALAELASPDVRLSYPIVETLYGTPVIRGRDALVEFSKSFCRRWTDASISVDRVVTDGDRVVLVWSFDATDRLVEDPAGARRSWGGISVFAFDETGRVIEEFGEESTPGPTARLSSSPEGGGPAP